MPDRAYAAHVVIAIDWPRAAQADRDWATELAVASLGWGSRFGADFRPVFLLPDPADASLPSGVLMYAEALSENAPVDAAAPMLILLGTPTPALRQLAVAAVRGPTPCLVRAGSAWASDPALASVTIVMHTLAAMIDAIHDGVELPDATHASRDTESTDVRVVREDPRVAIVIPTYNRAGYLAAAIDSALAQTYPLIEVIVADDGSTDHTAAVVRSRIGPRLRSFTKAHSNGPDTRNQALAGIDAPFVVWLGDDDLLTPECVASRVEMLARFPTADVIYGNLLMVDAELQPTGTDAIAEDWFDRESALLATLFERNPITEGGAMVRHSSIRAVQGYDPAFPKAHDYEFWSRLAPRARFKHDPTTAYIWRWHGGNMGLGGGSNPYQDAHVRIVLGLLSRHAPQELFPTVPWDQLDATAAEGVAALMAAVRLWREDAIDFALQFAQRAVECWPTTDSRTVLAQLQVRHRERDAITPHALVHA